MKAEEFLTMTVSQVFLGKVLGLTQGRISQLLAEGVLVRDEESQQMRLYDSLRSYWLSKNATGDGVNFWKERGLHEKAKRELSELKLSRARGEVYLATDVEAELASMLIEFRTKLLGIGHKLAVRLEGRSSAQICEEIDAEINDILMGLTGNVESARFEGEVTDEFEAASADDS